MNERGDPVSSGWPDLAELGNIFSAQNMAQIVIDFSLQYKTFGHEWFEL